MTEAHYACAALNFIGFLGFVTAILVITSHGSSGGHRVRRRRSARRVPAFAT
jgi:hypothetical protein